MKTLALSIFLSLLSELVAGAAFAKAPYFAAKCPTNITVETDRAGRAYINEMKASVHASNPNYYEIRASGTTISVAIESGSLIVSYTGKNRANGVCEVVEHETVESAPPAPPKIHDDVPTRDKQACLQAVKKKTKNPKAVVLETLSSEANNSVTVGIGAKRAPWRCLVKRGAVAEVMSQTNEGGL